MKISSMKASFGKLDEDTLELGSGLNIIQAPNESGKSTWCAFIKAVLYGVNTSERDKADSLSDKTKYQPWSGKAMQGVMELERDGKQITVTRSSYGKSPMRQFSAVYTGTNTQLENVTAQNSGQYFTGVSRDVFERTAFITHSGAKVGQTQELEKRLMSIVSTGDEDVSYSDTNDKLTQWLRRIQYRGKGLLPQAQSELETVTENIEKINQLNTQIAQLQNSDNAIGTEQLLLQQEAKTIQDSKLRQKAEKCAQYKAVYDAAKSKADGLRQAIEVNGHIPDKKQIDILREEYATFTAMAKAKDEANARLDSCPMPDNIPKTPTSSLVPAIIMAVIALIAAAASFVFESMKVPMIICAGVLVMAAVITACVIIRAYRKSAMDSQQIMLKAHLEAKQQAQQAQDEYEQKKKQIIDKAASIGISGELVSGMDSLTEKIEQYEKANNDMLVAQGVWQTWSEENTIPIEKLPDITLKPRFDSEQTARRLESAAQSRRQLRTQIDRAMGQLNMLGDISELSEHKKQLEERIRALKSRYSALELALETLQEANNEMQRRFSPALSRCAGNILTSLTNGKYTSVTFDRELSANVRQNSDMVGHSDLTLSHGTVQQVYLALRLAMCQMVLDNDNPCPIILDDALADYDDERTIQALEYLYELSKQRQIIIFTCHNREAMFIGGRDGVKVIKI